MIKREWIKESNGFKIGDMVLYIDPRNVQFSQVFRLKNYETEVSYHPAADDGKRPLLKVFAESPSSPYPVPMYLEFDGDLYPIESPQYALWNPARPDSFNFAYAIIGSVDHGHEVVGEWEQKSRSDQELLFTNDVSAFSRGSVKGRETYTKPDWATKVTS